MGETPERLGDFAVLRRIGAGGMAEVFLAEKAGAEGTRKRLVVKRVLPDHGADPRLYAMFVREARIATRLGHPNVVHVYELVEHPTDGLILAMEHVDGVDLGRVLASQKRRGVPIPPYVAAFVAREAAKGLHYAHERRDEDGTPLEIVHRDVSPQNLLLSRDGAVKIADLGIATARLYRDATTGLKGKFRYMAPEQAAGLPVDRRADVYALGVVLYEMLRLCSPYGARSDEALLRAVREGRFDPRLDALTDVPADLLAVVRRALATEVADRYASARDLADDLSRALVAQQRVIDETGVEALVRAVADEAAAAEATPSVEAATIAAVPRPARRDEGPTPRPLEVGSTVGRYVIEGRLGRGGMADVYAARDTTLARGVALKVLRGTTRREAREQLLREARLAATFEHPSSVVVYDVGEEGGVGFIAMELVRGQTLATYIGAADVPLGRRLRWLTAAARVLAAAHDAGLVHRDIKPSNLMIRESGEVKILDFGIARAASVRQPGGTEPPSTAEGVLVGTLRYAAPERFASGPVDARADQFSWGVTAWELLAGRHPFSGEDTVDTVGQMLLDGIGPLAAAAPDLPEEVTAAVDRTLRKAPGDRFASLHEVADALEPYAEVLTTRGPLRSIPDLGDAPRPSRAPEPPTPPGRPSRRRGPWIAAAVLGAALAGLGLARLARAPSLPPAVSAAAPVEPLVDAVGCSDAVLRGDGGGDLARAVGLSACARLGAELGVEWAAPAATHRLSVEASRSPGAARVTLRVAGAEATAAGAGLTQAVQAAVAALAPRLRTPAWTPEQVRLWGARDEAAGRRILRVWRRSALGVSPDISSEIKRLLASDGDSPMPHLLAVMNSSGGREELDAAPARIAERLDRLPAARADSLRAILLVFPAERDRKEAIRLFRDAFTAAPDDHSMVSLYAVLGVRLGLPEAHALIERLHAQAPTYALGPLGNAAIRSAYRDDERSARYVAWIEEILPEASARNAPVQFLASVGRFDDARAALDRGRRLGLDGAAADPLYHADARAQIELAALAPAAARAEVSPLLADPRFTSTQRGGSALVASYLQEGRLAEAEAALRQQAERQRDQGNPAEAAFFSLPALRLSRWLGRKADPVHGEILRKVFLQRPDVQAHLRLLMGAELNLAEGLPESRTGLGELEAMAERDAGDPLLRDRALVTGVALARRVRGDRAAAALWQRTERAPYVARRAAALDAALALEATGDDAGAEAAYRMAADPTNNMEDAPQRVLALARLALLQRRLGREAEARAGEATLDRLWKAADPGLWAAIKRMR
jgi:serine/threonine protein kinase